MTRVALALLAFSVSVGLMRDTAMMAADKKVGLHTHLAENVEDIDYSLANFNQRPGDYVHLWLDRARLHAHCVQLDSTEISLFAKTGTGVAHCPCRICALPAVLPYPPDADAGVKVGLGVDGSSSSDSGHLINEARQAMLLQRVLGGADRMTARQALRLATRGGADTLNRHDIGQIATGFAADLAIFDINCIDFTGTQSDPLAALVFCGPVKPRSVMVGGRMVVKDGALTTLDMGALLTRHDKAARFLLNRGV